MLFPREEGRMDLYFIYHNRRTSRVGPTPLLAYATVALGPPPSCVTGCGERGRRSAAYTLSVAYTYLGGQGIRKYKWTYRNSNESFNFSSVFGDFDIKSSSSVESDFGIFELIRTLSRINENFYKDGIGSCIGSLLRKEKRLMVDVSVALFIPATVGNIPLFCGCRRFDVPATDLLLVASCHHSSPSIICKNRVIYTSENSGQTIFCFSSFHIIFMQNPF